MLANCHSLSFHSRWHCALADPPRTARIGGETLAYIDATPRRHRARVCAPLLGQCLRAWHRLGPAATPVTATMALLPLPPRTHPLPSIL
eukprot:4041225-Pleurochrysis_carterae.AAC.1